MQGVSPEEVNATPKEECLETKMLGAHVDVALYWAFKGEAAKRQETMAEAIAHAARMYLDTSETK